MRLRILDEGHADSEREGIREWEQMAGSASDVTLALAYRPDFFGDPLNAWIQDVLREQSEWSVDERELVGAFTAHEHRCPFCAGAHGAAATLGLGADRVELALDQPDSPKLSAKLRAALALARDLVHGRGANAGECVAGLESAGVGRAGIEDVINDCAVFVVMARLALVFGFEGSADEHRREAEALAVTGYEEWRGES